MSQEIQLRPVDGLPELAAGPADPYAGYYGGGGGGGGYGEPPPQPEKVDTVFERMHRLLRGRYLWAVLLGTAFGGALGAHLYRTTRPVWQSTAQIHVKTIPDDPLQRPNSQVIVPFDQLKETQITLLKSQRLAEVAMERPEWKALGRPGSGDPAAVTDFMSRVTVTSVGKSEIINVSFSDVQERAARQGLVAVMAAYSSLSIEEEAAAEAQKKIEIENILGRLDRKKAEILMQVRDKALTLYGTDDLGPALAAKTEVVTRYEVALAEAKIARALHESRRQEEGPGSAADRAAAAAAAAAQEDYARYTAAQVLAKGDPEMRRLFGELREREENLQRLEAAGAGPNHPSVPPARLAIEQARAAIERRRQEWIAEVRANPAAAVAQTGTMTREQMDANIAQLEGLLAQARADLSKVGEVKRQLDELRKDLGPLEDKIRAITDIYEQRQRQTRERIRIVGEQVRPDQGTLEADRFAKVTTTPRVVKDSRVQYAAAGGVAGMGAGFALVMFFGLFDRRFRTPEDARSAGGGGRMALLGVLPNLPENLADPEQAAIAAHCVHQIRTLLQLGSSGFERRVFSITSPAAGTGKTSLTLSLGVSFAAAQSRTLLIDCDLIGGGLTIRVDTIIRRKIGQVLKREGLVTQQQLEAAMKLARTSHKKFGEILVELGHLKESDLRKALDRQIESPVGILDALAGENLMDCVAETGISGLYILPLGAAMPNDVSKLSPGSIRALLERARQMFDTILVDTGPVPGSLEASLVAGAADGVVMVVSRGEHRPLVERAIQHLRDIGAPIAGMVFNRAEGHDVELSNTTSRLTSYDRTKNRRTAESEYAGDSETPRFGPMARAVATAYPEPEPPNKGSASNNGGRGG